MYIQKKRIYANDAVDVAPEATDLLFEAEDVAELVAEVTDEEVTVETSEAGDTVEFTVGEDVFTIEADGDEEVLEASRRNVRGKRSVKASARRNAPRSRRRNVRKVSPRR